MPSTLNLFATVRCPFSSVLRWLTLILLGAPVLRASIPSPVGRDDAPMYHEFHDLSLSFIEATVDLRGTAPADNTNNLLPRAIVLNPGSGVFVAFDTELLRVAAVWQGEFLSPFGMAMASYPHPLKRIPGGQAMLAQPQGDIVAATGLYPGWQRPANLAFSDPRPRGVDTTELGRGPLPESIGRWKYIEDLGHSSVLHYLVYDRTVRESFTIDTDQSAVVRTLSIGPGTESLALILAEGTPGRNPITVTGATSSWRDDKYLVAEVPADPTATITLTAHYPLLHATTHSSPPLSKPASITTKFVPGKSQGAYAVDELTLPYPNPWERRLRLIDIAFWPNGDAAVVTFDGDVYRLQGLGSDTGQVDWTRIAAGFNEPQSIGIRDGELFVFSRGGITRLIDTDGDGDTDIYSLFSNLNIQSAETRGYPASMVIQANGEIFVSVGGVQQTSSSPSAGRVLRFSPDGRELKVFADGLRNGYLAWEPDLGIITASDQQGNWVPATPLHWIRAGAYYGFQSASDRPRELASVPLWIPHRVAQSGIDQLAGFDDRAGGLEGAVLYLDYQHPRALKILTDRTGNQIQAAAVSLPIEFEVPLLKGEINPADGLPYLVGMQIWDSLAPRLEGLCRLRPLSPDDGLPRAARIYREGVLLRFAHRLTAETALDPNHYRVQSWNYQRSARYGSGHFRADGIPGSDTHLVHSVLLAKDHHAVFIAMPDLIPAMQLEVAYQFPPHDQTMVYFSLADEPAFDPIAAGFDPINFNELFERAPAERTTDHTQTEISVEQGRKQSTAYGCIGCHSVDGTTDGKSGPSWQGLYRKGRRFLDGTSTVAEEKYLQDSILNPAKQIVVGFDGTEAGMPSYEGILSEADLQSIILYIQSLR